MRYARRLAGVIALAGLVLFAGGSGTAGAEGEVAFEPRFEGTECPVALPPGAVDGVDVRCGLVTVPERHAKPAGKTIQLAVAVVKGGGVRTVADPIVILEGGPGLSTMSETLPFVADLYKGPTGTLLQDVGRDFVLIEQRGNYYSKPALTCPELTAAFKTSSQADLNVGQRRTAIVAAYAACRDRLKASGIDLSAYNGVENAADVPMVVKALKYDRYNVYGVSYGTQLAQHLLRDHPEGIRSLVLNSVMPMDVNVNAKIPASAQRDFDHLFAACKANGSCDAAFPGLETTFEATIAKLNDTPLRLDGHTVTGDDMVRYLAEEFTPEGPGGISDLPRKIQAIANGETSWLRSRVVATPTGGTEALGMMYSTICAEDADFTRNDLDLDTTIERAMAAGRPAEMLAVCDIWGVTKLPPIVDFPVVSDVPAVLMTGEFDVITPPEFLPYAAAGLSKSYRLVAPARGHGGIDLCRLDVILKFVQDPTQAPQASCLDASTQGFNTRGPLPGVPGLPPGVGPPPSAPAAP